MDFALDRRELADGNSTAAALEYDALQRPHLGYRSVVWRAGSNCAVGSPRECPCRASFAERALHNRSSVRSTVRDGWRSSRVTDCHDLQRIRPYPGIEGRLGPTTRL